VKYVGTFNLELLHEELFEYVVLDPVFGKRAYYTLSLTPVGIDLVLLQSKDYSKVDVIVAAHDYTKKSQLELAREEKQAKKDAVLNQLGITKEQFKDLLSI
jgi:hypothetical protein